jgi:hypothetical protein
LRPIRRACGRIVRWLRSTPYVVSARLPGDVRTAASPCAVGPETRRGGPWTTRPGAPSLTTTASPTSGGGERRGWGTRPRRPCRGGVSPTPYPSKQASAEGGRASRGKHGLCPSGAAFRRKSRRRAGGQGRVPSTQAGPQGHTGLQAIQPQAFPEPSARCSSEIRWPAFLWMTVHHSSQWHACRDRVRKQ